jgi:hypothetical protein
MRTKPVRKSRAKNLHHSGLKRSAGQVATFDTGIMEWGWELAMTRLKLAKYPTKALFANLSSGIAPIKSTMG